MSVPPTGYKQNGPDAFLVFEREREERGGVVCVDQSLHPDGIIIARFGARLVNKI